MKSIEAALLWAGVAVWTAVAAEPADLKLSMSLNPPRPGVGRPLTVQLTVTNQGPAPASSIVCSNLLPPGVTFLSATSSLGSCALTGDAVRWDLGRLDATQGASATVLIRPDFAGRWTNTASVWGAEPDPNPKDNTATNAALVSAPFVSIRGTNLAEGDTGATNADFLVQIDAPSGEMISVAYITPAGDQGGATIGVDFLSVTGLLVFPPGVTNATISVPVLGDVLNEANETFSVRLFNPTNALLAQGGYAVCTILNDDPLPVVSVNDVTVLEGDTGTASAMFTVTLSAPSGRPASVTCFTVDGTAKAGSDYVATNRTLVFPTGTTTQTVAAAVRGNTVFEGDEWFSLRLEKPSNLTLGQSNGICTILDDDAMPGRLDHFGWSVVPSPQLEGIGFRATVTALDAFSNVVTAFNGDAPLAALDSPSGSSLTVTPAVLSNFTAGVWTGFITVSQTNPAVVLRADDGQEHTGTSDPFAVAPVPRLAIELPSEAREGDGVVTGQVSVATVLPRSEDLLVSVTVAGTNRAVAEALLTIPAGATNAVLSLTVLDNLLLDGSQTISVTVASSNCFPAQASLTIHDNEATALNLVLPLSVLENAGVVTGLLQAARAPDVEVAVSLASSDTNTVQVLATFVLPAGLTEAPVPLTVVDNRRIDGPRTVTLTAEVRYWTNAAVTWTVLDDETTNLVVVLPPSVVEGQGTLAGAGQILLTGTPSDALTVSLTSSDTNKVTVPATLTVMPWSTSAVFNLNVPDNALPQGTQPVQITAQAQGFTAASNVVHVIDNDPANVVTDSITSPQTSGVPFHLTIRVYDTDGAPATEYRGMVSLGAVGSSIWPVSPDLVGPFTNGVWSGMITVSGLEEVVRLALGVSGFALIGDPFLLKTAPLQVLGLHCGDLLFHPSNGWVYVSVPGNWPAVALLNPQDGRTQPWKGPLPFSPDRLALSSDGQTLYATFPADGYYGTFPLTGGFDCLGSFGAETWYGERIPYQVDDFEVLAGPGDSVVAARLLYHNFGLFKVMGARGVALFRQGTPLPDSYGQSGSIAIGPSFDPPPPIKLTASADGQTVYCSQPGFYAQLAVTTNGLRPVLELTGRPVPAFGASYGGEMVWDRGLLYRENGEVVDPDRVQLVGRFPINGLVRPDSALNRVFLLGRDGPSGAWRLSAYDQATFVPLDATNLAQVAGIPSSLIRCGSNTLAFRTSADQVFLLHGLLLPTEPETDLATSLQVVSAVIGLSNTTALTLTVTNQGTNPASGVVLSARVPAALGPITVTAGAGVCSASHGTLICNLPLLNRGASATVSFEVPALVAGRFPCLASVASLAQEADYTNNVSGVVLTVLSPADPAPRFTTLDLNGENVRLRFSTLGDECYRLERASSLDTAPWNTVLDYIYGSGEPLEVSDLKPPDWSACFYRVVPRR
jgi:uncharacterized repeat protein (TIGR01451 family)